MGAFNTLIINNTPCPNCGNIQDWRLQFKYGDCWQYEYQLGEKLNWGGNDLGKNIGGHVRTSGIAEQSCSKCKFESVEAIIYFQDNQIKKCELTTKPLLLRDYYEIIES